MGTRAQDLPNRVVLVVDDDEPVCHMSGHILAEEGFRVLETHEGREALDYRGGRVLLLSVRSDRSRSPGAERDRRPARLDWMLAGLVYLERGRVAEAQGRRRRRCTTIASSSGVMTCL